MILGYARGDHLMVKTNPFLMLRIMMMSTTSETEVPTSKDEVKRDDSAGRMDESGRGPRRAIAIAKAVARPLKIQLSMNSNTMESSSKRPVDRASAAIKATPSSRCYGDVPGHRAQTMP
jgi:hypothetical protein